MSAITAKSDQPFLDAAQRFRMVINEISAQNNDSGSRDRRGKILELMDVLCELYRAALLLPEPEVDAQTLSIEAPPSDVPDIASGLRSVIGPSQYWVVADQFVDEPEVTISDVAGDLEEIYSDIEEGFFLLEVGGTTELAIWDWRFDFWAHWGEHAVSALKALHELARPEKDST